MSEFVTQLAQNINGLARRVYRLESIEMGTASSGGGGGTAVFNDSANPANVGTVSATGVSDYAARRDHVHTIAGSALLAIITPVDGTGSGLDADLLDGIHSTGFLGTAAASTFLGTAAASGFVGTASYIASDVIAKLLTVDGTGSGLDADLLDGLHASAFAGTADVTAGTILAKLLTVDGAGSGLDADTLDGVQLADIVGGSATWNTLVNLSGGTPDTEDYIAFYDNSGTATKKVVYWQSILDSFPETLPSIGGIASPYADTQVVSTSFVNGINQIPRDTFLSTQALGTAVGTALVGTVDTIIVTKGAPFGTAQMMTVEDFAGYASTAGLTAINDLTLHTIAPDDHIVFTDTDDSGNAKKAVAVGFWNMMGAFDVGSDVVPVDDAFPMLEGDSGEMKRVDLGRILNGIKDIDGSGSGLDADTVDGAHYAEGTFTPTLSFGGGSTGMTYAANEGVYTKMGRLVFVSFYVNLSAKGSSTGAALLSGLPFNVTIGTANRAVLTGMMQNAILTGDVLPAFRALENTSTVNCTVVDSGAVSNMTDAHFGNSTRLLISGCYMAAS